MSASPITKIEPNLHILNSDKVNNELKDPEFAAYIFIKAFSSGNFEKIKYEEIVMIKSSGNYSTIFTVKGKSYFTSKTLKCWCRMLQSEKSFLRCHASYLINKNTIIGIDKAHQKIQLENDLMASVSRKSWNSIVRDLYQDSNFKIY